MCYIFSDESKVLHSYSCIALRQTQKFCPEMLWLALQTPIQKKHYVRNGPFPQVLSYILIDSCLGNLCVELTVATINKQCS